MRRCLTPDVEELLSLVFQQRPEKLAAISRDALRDGSARAFSVDIERLRELRMTAAREADPLAMELRGGLGKPRLNLESKPQLVAAFNAAGIDIADTDDDTLAARTEPLVLLLRAYRKPASLVGYIGTLIKAQRGAGFTRPTRRLALSTDGSAVRVQIFRTSHGGRCAPASCPLAWTGA